jgi:F420H(2)-dependent quinone reductase
VLLASKGGDDRGPDRYRNLLAHPEIELTMGRLRRPMRARRASPAEKAELWPQVVAGHIAPAADSVTAGPKRARLTGQPAGESPAHNPRFGAAPTVLPIGQPAAQSGGSACVLSELPHHFAS